MKRSKRDSNMDLLRCILILMVLTVHYINAGMGGAITTVVKGSINYYFIYFIESLAIVAVDGFVMLSGYYSMNRSKTSFRKPIGLFLTVIGYNYLIYLLGVVLGIEKLSFNQIILNIIPQNWYVILFVVLYIFSPYLNLVIHKITQKQLGNLVAVGVVVFSVWENIADIIIIPHTNTVGSISTISVSGGASGYSIINFILLYFVGAFLKNAKFSISKVQSFTGYLSMAVIVFAGSFVSNHFWNYNNVFVIAEAAFLVLFFEKVHIRSALISSMAASTLGVFIIHTQYLICYKAWSYFKIGEYTHKTLFFLILNMVLVVGVTFIACTVVDQLLRRMLKPFSKLLDKNQYLSKNVIDIDL